MRTARCAGPIFLDSGRRIRAAQDCSRRYGGAIGFQQILRLTPDEYEETSLGGVSPRGSGGFDSTHTYARAGSLELLDEAGPGPKPG